MILIELDKLNEMKKELQSQLAVSDSKPKRKSKRPLAVGDKVREYGPDGRVYGEGTVVQTNEKEVKILVTKTKEGFPKVFYFLHYKRMRKTGWRLVRVVKKREKAYA